MPFRRLYSGLSTSLHRPASFSRITARASTNAFGKVYVPRGKYDAYAATGVEGDSKFEANFRAGVFKWKEWDDWA
jgi:hypothetical protein